MRIGEASGTSDPDRHPAIDEEDVHLRLTRHLYEQVRADLARPHQFAAERVGFLFAELVNSNSATPLVLFTGYIMAVVRGGSGGLGRRPHVWRGEVIDLRPGGRGLAYLWWRLRANLRNDKR